MVKLQHSGNSACLLQATEQEGRVSAYRWTSIWDLWHTADKGSGLSNLSRITSSGYKHLGRENCSEQFLYILSTPSQTKKEGFFISSVSKALAFDMAMLLSRAYIYSGLHPLRISSALPFSFLRCSGWIFRLILGTVHCNVEPQTIRMIRSKIKQPLCSINTKGML